MTRRAAVLLVLFAFLGRTAAGASPPPPATPEGILSFARAVLATGDSFRAATEYLRFLYHFSEHPAVPEALEGLGRAQAQAGRWDDAITAFRRLLAVRPDNRSRYLLGAALYKAGRYEQASRGLLAPETEGGGAILGTLALLRVGQVDDLPPGAREDLAEQYAAIERKSPGLAGTLSAVLPGAGHLYCDRPRDAAISFLLNGAFIWGTYESVRREQWALAAVLGFFEFGWYTGNVVSSVNAAHKWNRREEGRFFHRWEEATLPRWNLVLAPGTAGAGLTWRW